MEPRVGDKGYFGRGRGEKTYGEVTKVNRKTLKVRQLEARGTQKAHAVGTVWTVAKSLWTPEDNGRPTWHGYEYRVNSEPEPPKPKRPDAEIVRDLLSIECALSPENLHCDGEISMSAARRKGQRLRQRQRELVRELGRELTSQELCRGF